MAQDSLEITHKTVEHCWLFKLLNYSLQKSSLQWMDINPDLLQTLGRCHSIWNLARPTKYDVKNAMIKAKMLTGTYITQAQ